MRRGAATAAALLCALAWAASPALSQTTSTNGLEPLYERFPITPRGGTAPAEPPAPATMPDGGSSGGPSSATLLVIAFAVGIPIALVTLPATRRLRRRRPPGAAGIRLDARGRARRAREGLVRCVRSNAEGVAFIGLALVAEVLLAAVAIWAL